MKTFVILISIIFLSIIIIIVDTMLPFVKKLTVKIDKIGQKKSVAILQITDLHGKSFGRGNKRLFKLISQLKFDFIAITGDVIDEYTKNNERYLTELYSRLKSYNKPIYFVPGNHDEKNWYSIQREILKKYKIHILENKNEQAEYGDVKLNVCGVMDYRTKTYDLNKSIQGIDNDNPVILLSHSPNIINKIDGLGIDLILSGHTHGGQICLPFLGAILIPDQKIRAKYIKGLYNINKTKLYICSGLGTRWMPFRFFNRCQISLITLN